MRKIDAISRHLCTNLFTDTFKIDESIKKHTIVETFCMISNRAMVSFWDEERSCHVEVIKLHPVNK